MKHQSIECQKAWVKSRNTKYLRPETDERLGELVYPIKLHESAKAEIHKELKPKKARIDPRSKLNQGDKIVGKTIIGFATDPISPHQVKHDSSRHRGQFTLISGFVYCAVTALCYDLSRKQLPASGA